MREILFKAKRKDNGKWIEGSLIILDADSDFYFIVPEYKYASTMSPAQLIGCHMELVDPKTVCEYTGLKDKSGIKIFENDLIGCDMNCVETLNGEWCVNGDRPLFFMAKEFEIVGNKFD